MKKIVLACVILFSVVVMGACSNTDTYLNSQFFNTPPSTVITIDQENSLTDMSLLAEKISPAIVGVSCVISGIEHIGSGVCVASGGYVLTNQHVINGGKNITLYLHDGSTASAKLLWQDSSLDIAILKSSTSLPYLSMGNTDYCKVGQDILAVGTPINLQFNHTFTRGIISALNRTLLVSTGAGSTYMQNLIQHDASINPGNSGGPLVNSYGEVIGINTLKISDGEGLGFAIPTKSFKSIVESITGTQLSSYVAPYSGIFAYDALIASYYDKTDINEGVYIIDVAEGSPAQLVGIQQGDVIVQADNERINNMLDLRDIMFRKHPGDIFEVLHIRNGKQHKSSIQLVAHPTNNIMFETT